MRREAGLRVNVGCGTTPTPGYLNFDNSPTVRLATFPILPSLLSTLGVLGRDQNELIEKTRAYGIRWADATKRLPLTDRTVALLYSSHMVEHLTTEEADAFIQEAYRVLQPGDWVRIAVPDLRRQAIRYVRGDSGADEFIRATLLTSARPTGLGRLKWLAVGPRHHLWMYDGSSLSELLSRHGFTRPTELRAGLTNVSDPGALDLYERAEESVYVEAQKS